jgi:gentisate 1,2-dioxygenase
MLERSSITTPEAVLQDYYEDLKQNHLSPLWTQPAGREEPESRVLPFLWPWREMRPRALRALDLVGTKEAERRVICCVNPGIGRGATNTLVANVQVVGPGEIARAHRHTAAALRMIIESTGGYTVVNGEAIPMLPGDLVLTPNWTWHDHANDSDTPMIWLDGLDAPLVGMLEAAFRDDFPEETQKAREDMDVSFTKYGSGAFRPAWESTTAGHSPLWHYPWTQTKMALDRLAAMESGSPFDGIILEYTNPATGAAGMHNYDREEHELSGATSRRPRIK